MNLGLTRSGYRGATIEDAGGHNTRIVLRAIRAQGMRTKADLARQTGLAHPTVTNITRRLIERGADLSIKDDLYKATAEGAATEAVEATLAPSRFGAAVIGAVGVLALLRILLQHTRTGLAFRAVASNRASASRRPVCQSELTDVSNPTGCDWSAIPIFASRLFSSIRLG